MNFIDFTLNGGYRLKQFTLRKMQEATFQILKAWIAFCNVPEIGTFIVAGCKIVGPNITDGYLYIDGELCKFTQTAGDGTSKIAKIVVTQTLAFFNGSNPSVFRFTHAAIDPTGTALSTIPRVSPVFDANYVHTDNNYTNAEVIKLAGIEAGAEVNVQADWTESDNTADSYIKNKPVGNLDVYLAKGNVVLGDMIGALDVRTISLGMDVGTTDYHVDGDLIGTFAGTDAGECRAHFITKRKTNISFDILLWDDGSYGSQNFEFSWRVKPY